MFNVQYQQLKCDKTDFQYNVSLVLRLYILRTKFRDIIDKCYTQKDTLSARRFHFRSYQQKPKEYNIL